MRFLVFLEHHEGRLHKDSLGLLSRAASLGEDVTLRKVMRSGFWLYGATI